MQNTFLYTLPQWFIFSALIMIAYGWVENKKIFRLIGSSVFFLLGIFAVYNISMDSFSASEFLTPAEVVAEEADNETMTEIPFIAKLLPAYIIFIISGILSVPAFWFDWKNKKPTRLFIILTGLVSLTGFFIIVDALKAI